jgi:hypothetical protein
MNTTDIGYKVENGLLKGSEGQWEIKKISAVYKKEGGKLGLAKFLIVSAGLAAAGAAIAISVAHFAVIGAGAFGYLTHRTMRVFAVIEGCEVELLAEIYWQGIWGEDRANARCSALINLINQSKNA